MALSTNISKTILLIALGLVSPTLAFTQFQSLPDEPAQPRQVEKVPKRDFLYLASEAYLVGGTVVDMRTTAEGLDHPTSAYTTSGKFLMQYTIRESGWASFLGVHNTFRVTTANVLMNTGLDLLDRKLYRRGGRWRIAAISLNVAKATIGVTDGLRNMKVLGNVDKVVQLQTGYRGAVVWR